MRLLFLSDLTMRLDARASPRRACRAALWCAAAIPRSSTGRSWCEPCARTTVAPMAAVSSVAIEGICVGVVLKGMKTGGVGCETGDERIWRRSEVRAPRCNECEVAKGTWLRERPEDDARKRAGREKSCVEVEERQKTRVRQLPQRKGDRAPKFCTSAHRASSRWVQSSLELDGSRTQNKGRQAQ